VESKKQVIGNLTGKKIVEVSVWEEHPFGQITVAVEVEAAGGGTDTWYFCTSAMPQGESAYLKGSQLKRSQVRYHILK